MTFNCPIFVLVYISLLNVVNVHALHPFSNEAINDWLHARCGGGSAIWTYEGNLYDPLDGRKICQVEGLELVRNLAGPTDGYHRRSDLVGKDLTNGTTILSRKFFCYKSSDEAGKLLSTIKLRPNAPTRVIPTNQVVALFDTATTVSSRHNGKELVVHTEFPNGKCYWATAESADEPPRERISGTKSFEFTVYTKKRPTDLPDSTKEITSDGLVVAPKRSKIIQFGAGPKLASGRFGARETYSYTITKPHQAKPGWKFWVKPKVTLPTCSVKYTRYGEGPPWYGPGKYLTLEVKGRRIDSMQEVPALSASIASEIRGFMTVDKSIDTDEEAKQAVLAFREEGLLQLPQQETDSVTLKNKAIAIWKKVRMASNHQAGKS
jgi:hypothetical protein